MQLTVHSRDRKARRRFRAQADESRRAEDCAPFPSDHLQLVSRGLVGYVSQIPVKQKARAGDVFF